MATFELSGDYLIRGDQLVAEILAATGVDVSMVYSFTPPRTVEIVGVDDRSAEIQAVIDAHVPRSNAPTEISRVDFALKMSAEERIAIRASTDPLVVDVRELLALAERVDLTHPATVAGVELLEQVGVLAAGRAAEILAP